MNNYALKMEKYTKTKRQAVLREVLAKERVGGHDNLRAALRKRGVRTTQATISRDLRELGVVKAQVAPGVFAYRIEPPAAPAPEAARRRLQAAFRDFVVEVNAVALLVLIKTAPGNAAGVASLIDAVRRPGILGTVAGDDTILVVADSEIRRAEVEIEFRALLQGAS